jgi:cytochrome oxidase Cu insertion factor (SCO1/SenC/PrrC family)
MKDDGWQMTRLFGRAWSLLGLLAVALAISACGTTLAADPVVEAVNPTSVLPSATPDASRTMPTPIPGAQMAPDFSLPDLDGQTWTLSQFRGQPVMLFVWATW